MIIINILSGIYQNYDPVTLQKEVNVPVLINDLDTLIAAIAVLLSALAVLVISIGTRKSIGMAAKVARRALVADLLDGYWREDYNNAAKEINA